MHEKKKRKNCKKTAEFISFYKILKVFPHKLFFGKLKVMYKSAQKENPHH